MGSASTTTPTMGAKLIGVQENHYRPYQLEDFRRDGTTYTRRIGVSRPTKCIFLAEDGSLKWVGVNAGVFPGQWYFKDTSRLEFPPFPSGSWTIGQIRRLENGEVAFTKTLEVPLDGIDNAFIWHPTKIEFTEFELLSPFKNNTDARLWHAKHPRFGGKPIFVKLAPWANNWSKLAMEAETEVYKRIDGRGIAPQFLGHVTYRGAVIGFILEWIEGVETTKKADRSARIKVMKKLHALGITHGTAHRNNFLKTGEGVLIIDFEEARFDNQATILHKAEDLRRIRDFRGDFLSISKVDDFVPEINKYFDDLVDDEINWTEDSAAEDD